MRTTLFASALALGAMTSVALAEPAKLGGTEQHVQQPHVQQAYVLAGPVALTEAQMDTVTAGQDVNVCVACVNAAVQLGIAAVIGDGDATVIQIADQSIN